jgi:phage terminase Nu1 subunit (DNA packaging protein)
MPDGPFVEPLLVNKQELAQRVLKCSLPTLSALITRYPDFPAERRGAKGASWLFDAPKVVAFLDRVRAEEARAMQERNALFEQFSLPIDGAASGEMKGLTPAQRASLARARLDEQKLAREAKFLVPVSSVRQAGMTAFRQLGAGLSSLSNQIAKEFGLPPEAEQKIRERIDDFRRQFVGELRAIFDERSDDTPQ